MHIERKYRRANHVGGIRQKLAKMIVTALAKDGIEARCEAKNLWPALGYWRQVEQDVYSWEGSCEVRINENWLRKSLGSWDRMSSCVKGLTIYPNGFGFEVAATNEMKPSDRFRKMRGL